MSSHTSFSRTAAPIAPKEDDTDEVESSPLSHLTARPFQLPMYPNNMYRLKPLREPVPDAEELPTKPTGASEFDEDDPEDQDNIPGGPGIDDGLLPEKPKVPTMPRPKTGTGPRDNGEFPPSHPVNPFGDDPRQETPDINVYQHKKTVAQGMMDIALLSANANQLRYVLESGRNHPYYYASLTLIGISLLLQVVVGVGLILNSRYNVSYETSMRKANRINNYTVLAIFLITVMNVFISAFGIASVNTTVVNFPPSPRLISGSSEVDLP